jgi:Carboxypeptidase regulatory-like domain
MMKLLLRSMKSLNFRLGLRKGHMHLKLRNLIFPELALILLLGAGRLFAQSTGSVRGTVSDSSGAAIPDASVTVTNTQTAQTRSTQTTGSGVFVFPELPIGSYELQVSKTGFNSQKRGGTQLLTGQTIGLDIILAVGSQTESVSVQADTQQIQTTTSTVSQSIDEKQMQDLPLNGRNPLQLTTLTPGARLTNTGTESGQQDNQGLTVNGLRATQNNFQLDGALYVDRFFDSVPILPSPDALQEFTIQAANYSAAYAGAGALVQLSARSGTNRIHGSAYEFFRNTVLDANNYFPVKSPTGAIILPPYKLNQFGGTVGGPIRRDKTFFFFSAEDLQQRSSPNPATLTLPTAAQVAGDFSALCTSHTFSPTTGICTKGVQIFNPVTGQPYAGNIITTPMDTLSKAVYNQYLASTPGTLNPNSPTTNAFTSLTNSNIDSTQYLVRIDHAVADNNHLSGRYFYNQDNFQRAFTAPIGFYAANLFRNQSLTISDTQVFSPTLTATGYITGGRFARTQIPEAPGLKTLQSLGQNIPLGTSNVPIFPGVRNNISGYVDVFSGGALTQDSTSFEFKGEVVKLVGANTFTIGGALERTRIDATDFSYVPGDNTFNGQRTQAPTGTVLPAGVTSGNAYADFYTGYESSFFQDNGRKFYLREWRPSLFFQDDWKVTRNLTLNLGLRWDPWVPPIDKNNTLVGFVPGFQSTIAPGAPVGLQFEGDPGSHPAVFKNNYHDFAPRFGFAYNVKGAGKTVVRGAFGIFYGFPEGLLYQRTDAAQPVNLYLNLVNPPQWDNVYTGFAGGVPFPRGSVNPSQFATYNFITPFSGGVLNPASKVEYTEDYNLTVEQQLPWNFALSVAYVGNHALHVMGSRQFNPAVYAPGATVGNEQARRLYPGLGAVELADSYEYANYNSLQINVTRRVANNLTLLTNLVYSKVFDNNSSATEGNSGPPNPFNLASAYGPADFDQKIRFNASINYRLPKFQVNRFAGAVINGWQANSIIFVQTGMPFTILSGTDRSLSGIGNDYADAVPGVSPARPSGASKITSYFNPAAFVQAATGTFGDTARNFLRGPGYIDVDASVFKDLFTERRVQGQFRAEAFNLFNHTNLNNPGSTVSSSGSFGHITGANSPRVFQFGAKVLF